MNGGVEVGLGVVVEVDVVKGVQVGVAEGVKVGVRVAIKVGVTVKVKVCVGVAERVAVKVRVEVAEGIGVKVRVEVGVDEAVGVREGVLKRVGVDVGVKVDVDTEGERVPVGVLVGVGVLQLEVRETLSKVAFTRAWPLPETSIPASTGEPKASVTAPAWVQVVPLAEVDAVKTLPCRAILNHRGGVRLRKVVRVTVPWAAER